MHLGPHDPSAAAGSIFFAKGSFLVHVQGSLGEEQEAQRAFCDKSLNNVKIGLVLLTYRRVQMAPPTLLY